MREVIRQNYTVLFTTAQALVSALVKAHGEGRLEKRLSALAEPKLVIVDELGYLPFDPNAAHLFFQLVSRRYEQGVMLITSNRRVGERGTVFGNPSSPPPFSTGCCTIAVSSPPGETAIDCAKSDGAAFCRRRLRRLIPSPSEHETASSFTCRPRPTSPRRSTATRDQPAGG